MRCSMPPPRKRSNHWRRIDSLRATVRTAARSSASSSLSRSTPSPDGATPIDPLRRPFQFREVANRRLIHDTMSFAVAPFAAPFLISKRRHQPKRLEDLHQRFSVRHFCLGLDRDACACPLPAPHREDAYASQSIVPHSCECAGSRCAHASFGPAYRTAHCFQRPAEYPDENRLPSAASTNSPNIRNPNLISSFNSHRKQ